MNGRLFARYDGDWERILRAERIRQQIEHRKKIARGSRAPLPRWAR
jgi:hypothetical protein